MDEKFFLDKNKLAALNAFQAEMAPTQNGNGAIIQKQLNVCEQNVHILPDCNQKLFSNSN